MKTKFTIIISLLIFPLFSFYEFEKMNSTDENLIVNSDKSFFKIHAFYDETSSHGNVFDFIVTDIDDDGLPSNWELIYTNPSSKTGLKPYEDLDNDGLNNLEEYIRGTNPLVADTDADGISDFVESNTGIWVDLRDTGTNPLNNDSDEDGLTDAVETNTGVFVDINNTGTNPLQSDSDNDGAGDWYEVYASMTNPLDAMSKPNVPYPLPVPDATGGVANKPVKVYILSGQSNMVGFGKVTGDGLGTLATITRGENKFPHMLDDQGNWVEHQDVYYRGVVTDIGNSNLKPLMAGDKFGPEMGFGMVMGYHHEEPVLIIKTSQGNRSLSWDCLPPGSASYQYNNDGNTYAGYGDSPSKWITDTKPEPIGWYAGKQYDDFFLDEADFGSGLSWINDNSYKKGLFVNHNGISYVSKIEHISTAETKPGIGSNWDSSWKINSIFNVTDVLDNFESQYPQWANQGFEIAGFAWWQGHKDQDNRSASRYEENMVRFIKSLRSYYTNRYPGKIKPNAPFVLGTIGFNGWGLSGAGLAVANAQLAVSGDSGIYPDFKDNVKTMEMRDYWRSFGPSGQGYHYNWNAETYLLVGDALGRAMITLNNANPSLSVLDGKKTNNISVYINSETSRIQVEGLQQNHSDLHVFNILGQEVASYKDVSVAEFKKGIDISSYPKGVFILKLKEIGEKDFTITKKIIRK